MSRPLASWCRAGFLFIMSTPAQVSISQRSTLVIQGEGEVTIHSLRLDGALVITAAKGAKVAVKDCTVENKGWQMELLGGGKEYPEVLKIRGYELKKYEQAEATFSTPGEHLFTGTK